MNLLPSQSSAVSLTFRAVYTADCLLCGAPTVLPHQSSLGTFRGQLCQPNPVWPIKLLCVVTAQVCEHPFDKFRRRDLETPYRTPQTVVLWQVECECARENCGRKFTLYAWYREDMSKEDLIAVAVRAKANLHCDGHDLVRDPKKVAIVKVDIWS